MIHPILKKTNGLLLNCAINVIFNHVYKTFQNFHILDRKEKIEAYSILI